MKIGGMTLEDADLQLPDRLSTRHAIAHVAGQRDLTSVQQTAILLIAASLLLCWPKAQRKGDAPVYRQNLLSFGADAFDYLMGHGATLDEIVEGGNKALRMVLDSVIRTEDVEDAKGNLTVISAG